MQDVATIVARVKDLQQQIIAAATGSVDDRAKRLSHLQEELEQALASIQELSEAERGEVLPVIKQFSEQLKQRIDVLQQEMRNIRSSAENTKSHANVAKAYSGKIF